MNVVKTLIDKWAEERKEKALAVLLECSPQKLSAYKSGALPMPADKFLRLVELVDAPARERLAYAYLKAKAEKISARFKVLLRRGMAAISIGCVLA